MRPDGIKWRWVLSLALTGIVMVLLRSAQAEYQSPNCPIRGMDAPGDMEPLPLLTAKLLAGPAFYVVPYLPRLVLPVVGVSMDVATLFRVALLWFWIGLLLDRRVRGTHEWLISQIWLRIVVFGTLLTLSGFFSFMHVWSLNFEELLPWQGFFRVAIRGTTGISFWWTPRLSDYPQLLWTLLGVCYFANSLWRTVRMKIVNPASSKIARLGDL